MSGLRFWAQNLFWPDRNLSRLGRILGAMSVIAILRDGFDYGVSHAFAVMVGYYDKLVGALLGWATPFLHVVTHEISQAFGADLVLYPHWKHIFVLLGIYFFRNAANNTQHEQLNSKIFKYVLSGVFALVFSGATGLIRLDTNDMAANFWVAAIPILGAWLYDVVYLAWHATFLRKGYADEYKFKEQQEQSWTAFFVTRSRNASIRYVIGLVLAAVLLQIPVVQDIPGAGLVVLAFLVILLGFYWMARGMNIRRNMIREGQAPGALPALPSIKLGSEMLGVFAAALVFLLVNAGLGMYGL